MSPTKDARVTDLSLTLELLRDQQPRTRGELADLTGHARSTVAARVGRLLLSGLVTPAPDGASTGGRPPTSFAFNPAARVAGAVDLGATHVRVAVTDLAAGVLAERSEAVVLSTGPGPVLGRTAALLAQLLGQAGRTPGELVGVGVGLPGPVDHATGRPTNPPLMPGWDDADVAGCLHRHLDVPVLVDNDVNVMALGEHATHFPDVGHLLFVKVATGIGAGLISDGGLRRGARGAAGDIGHIAVPGEARPCRCGNSGCVEAVASGLAIAADLTAAGTPAASCADVVRLVTAGDADAVRAVREAGRRVGEVLATCVSLLNPSVIVLGGSIAEAGDQLLAGVREVVYRRSLPLATQHLQIVTSRARGRAGVLGAATMVIEHALSGEALDALV